MISFLHRENEEWKGERETSTNVNRSFPVSFPVVLFAVRCSKDDTLEGGTESTSEGRSNRPVRLSKTRRRCDEGLRSAVGCFSSPHSSTPRTLVSSRPFVSPRRSSPPSSRLWSVGSGEHLIRKQVGATLPIVAVLLNSST